MTKILFLYEIWNYGCFFFIVQNHPFIGKTIIFAEKPFCTDDGEVLLQCQISFLTI